jgi:riboflavin synthase
MFTGLVEGLGEVVATKPAAAGVEIRVDMGPLAADVALGDSICTSGACLSVTKLTNSVVSFDVSPESLAKTTLGERKTGDLVNLERSLRADTRLGGHFVSGHVDGLGELLERRQEGEFATFRFRAPDALAALLVPKGSVAIDGVSLTVAALTSAQEFEVALIPDTLERTTLGRMQIGQAVNLEGDLLGKYVLRAAGLALEQPDLWQATRDLLGLPPEPGR